MNTNQLIISLRRTRGQVIDLNWCEHLEKVLRRLQVIRGVGMEGTETADGHILDVGASSTFSDADLPPWSPLFPLPYTGDGEAPDDWGLNFQIQPGTVDNLIASNINTIFTADASSTWFGWIQIERTARATTGFSYHFGSAMPTVTYPGDASASEPPYFVVPMFRFDTDASGIFGVTPFIDQSFTVSAQVIPVNCGTYNLVVSYPPG